QAAKARLFIAVPAALLFILILLYITFRSVKESLLIFTAVPLASMGGVAALLLRGMPFSISAGVGFIALFGVAVLNGIVLIGYFNQLKDEGMDNIYDRVLTGTKTRLRPVLMTASVASLGFLPMALSASAGAEVQRPLATVVIGGLITATFLTLFVLPCLYLLFNRKETVKVNVPKALLVFIFAGISLLLQTTQSQAQSNPPLTLDSAIAKALRNNLQVRSAGLTVEQSRALQKSGTDIPKTELMLTQDPTSGGNMDNAIGITQNVAWPGLYKNQRKLLNQQTLLAERTGNITRAEITRNVRNAYYAYLLNRETLRVLNYQDSIYLGFVKKAEIRMKTGETSSLELFSARNKYQEVRALKIGVQADLKSNELALKQLLNTNEPIMIAENQLPLPIMLPADTLNINHNTQVNAELQNIEVANARVAVEKSKGMPDLTIGYNQQLVISGFNPAGINRGYSPGTRIAGIQLGVALPVFNGANRSRVKAEKLSGQIAQTNYQNVQSQVRLQYEQEMQQYQKFRQSVDYYTAGGLKQADEQLRIAQVSFKLGEIGYIEYIQNLSAAVQIKLAYIETVSRLNQSAIQLQFLRGE
ncbi:MAG TPA: efflux RND transporter permease subunit, partial [Mucilaginibacter sp.]|nr:efflux RND transporter permease subunit [Mucilaginibacter sp.]